MMLDSDYSVYNLSDAKLQPLMGKAWIKVKMKHYYKYKIIINPIIEVIEKWPFEFLSGIVNNSSVMYVYLIDIMFICIHAWLI